MFLAAFFIFNPTKSLAASLYLNPTESTLHSGDSVTLAVRLDVDEKTGECVNAVDAVIKYPDNVNPVDVSIGDSIFTVWVEKPTINTDSRTISFAGGIPNGYCGRINGDPRLTNVLAKIIFQAPGFMIGGGSNNPQAKIEFTSETTAYLNDGLGTKAQLTTYGALINIISKPGEELVNDWQDKVNEDKIKPEPFTILLEKGERAFGDKYFIVFNTTDKQTGIDHYEVMEEPLSQLGAFEWGRADAPWIVTRSPYVLKDQSLNSTIRVKAVDKAGNERIATLVPDVSLRTASVNWLNLIMIMALALLAVVLGVIAARFVKTRRKDKRFSFNNRKKKDDKDNAGKENQTKL